MRVYPRVCRNGHQINGPEDDYPRPGRRSECRSCKRDEKTRYRRSARGAAVIAATYKRRTESGEEASRKMRRRFRLADERDAQLLKELRECQ